MKAVAAVLAILLFAAAATAYEVGHQLEGEAGFGTVKRTRAASLRVIGDSSDILSSAPVVAAGGDLSALIGGRKMLQDVVRAMGTDGDSSPVTINTTLNTYSKIGKYCSNDNTVWGAISNYNATLYSVYGDLVHDAAICDVNGTLGKGKVVTTASPNGLIYGGTAQDFGPTRANWESYGWSLFKLTNPPADTYSTDVKIQGIQLHLIGNVGRGHNPAVTCSVKGISLAIYKADQDAPYNPTTVNYTKTIWLNGTSETTFTWNSNKTAILYTDIAPSADAYPTFQNGTFYWLRIKIFTDFTGSTGTGVGQCYAFWGLSSKVANEVGVRSRWQEKLGGAQGFSTSCLGATDSGTDAGSKPGQYQTWWNCWNNGLNTLAGNTGRRCSTYRSTVNPAIPSADCLDPTQRARFNDYNYAFTGHQAQTGLGENTDGEAGAGGGPDLFVEVQGP